MDAPSTSLEGPPAKNRDLHFLTVLLVVHFAVQAIFFRHLGRFIVDAGKELVVPWMLQDGQMLYRDLFWLYGPWAPHFNSLLYNLFGVHADVLLWCSKVLGAAILVGVYLGVRTVAPPKVAFTAGMCVLGFSTTSNYFAWPYSFSNLWATGLALYAVLGISRWTASGRLAPLFASFGSVAVILASKFIIALPVLVALWSVVLLSRKWNTTQAARPLLTASLYTVLAAAFYVGLTWSFGQDVSAGSYRLQAGAVFHAHHLAAAGLYERFAESVFLQNGLSAEHLAAAAAIVLCPLMVLGAVLLWWVAWKQRSVERENLLRVLPIVVFAAGNLLQMNSSVHAPYVFPASAIAWLGSLYLWRASAHAPARVVPHRALIWLTVFFCISLGVGRLVKSTVDGRTVEVSGPRFRFQWSRPNGPFIQSVADHVRAETKASDRIIVFSGHDFIYLLADRKPALGYFYTWYEPFHDPAAAQRVIAALRSFEVTMVVTHLEDPFSLAFAPDYRAHPIYSTLRQEFEPRIDRDRWGGFVVWEKRSASPAANGAPR